MAVTGGTAPVKRIEPGEHAPTGPSVAAKMLQKREAGRHYTLRVRREGQEAQRKAASQRSAAKAAAKPYNALVSPYKTQGEFESAVKANAKTQYQPELDTLNTEEQGEGGLHQQREGENAKTYDEYSKQAQDAFERAKAAMAEIAARQNSGTAAGQQALQAALSNTGVSGLAAVPNAQPFMAQASGLGNAQSQALAGMQSGSLGEFSKNLLVPGAGRAEAQFKEQARSSGVLGKLGVERRKVLGRVPDIISKTRADMTKEEQAREANAAQIGIARGKLGLEKTTQAQTNATNKQKIAADRAAAREANDAKLKELVVNAGFEGQKIDIQRKDLQNKIAEAGNAKAKLAAEIAAKRYDKGLEIMAHNLGKNDKTEFQETQDAAKNKAEEAAGKRPYRRDAMKLYTQLTKQAFLTAPEAFNAMESSGNGYVEAFAREHREDYENQERLRHHTPTSLHSPAHTGRGGLRGH